VAARDALVPISQSRRGIRLPFFMFISVQQIRLML
jgi:hypothetical protein